jgi:hypothetical protein
MLVCAIDASANRTQCQQRTRNEETHMHSSNSGKIPYGNHDLQLDVVGGCIMIESECGARRVLLGFKTCDSNFTLTRTSTHKTMGSISNPIPRNVVACIGGMNIKTRSYILCKNGYIIVVQAPPLVAADVDYAFLLSPPPDFYIKLENEYLYGLEHLVRTRSVI